MRLFVYGFREEEKPYFDQYCKQYGITYDACKARPKMENAHLAKGYTCISILSTKVDRDLIKRFKEFGVAFISTRTIGYEHIDNKAARDYDIRYGNVQYASHTVANYTVMIMMMALRKVKLIMQSANVQDYSFTGVLGQNLQGKTVGIIGCGSIGQMLIKNLQGFDCEILVYSRNIKPIDHVQFVTFDELCKRSDVITLHLPLHEETYHILDQKAFSRMKDGVTIVNTARGGLLDSKALIEAVESGKVGAAALDVLEDEGGIYYNNCKSKVITHREMAILNAFPNVILLPHMAWLSDDAIGEMVECSVKSCYAYMKKADNPWEIT